MSINQLVNPASVVYVGASRNRGKLGFRVGQYAANSSFSGEMQYVSRTRELFGRRTFRSLKDISGIPDCVVIAVPAQAVAGVLEDAAEMGTGAAVILSSGFSEMGQTGEVLQQQIQEIAAAAEIAICGPNSLGVVNFHSGFTASFSQGLDYLEVRPGPVAVLTQSGFFGSILFVSLAQEGWGPSLYISTGNEAGIDLADALEIASQDPHTQVVTCYLEGIRSGAKLLKAASKCVSLDPREALFQ